MINDPLKVIYDFVHESGLLTKVEYLFNDYFDFAPVSLILHAEHRLLVVNAVAEDDTVELTTFLPVVESGYTLMDVSSQKPWQKLLHHRLQWAWLLTNQQGYFDGIQFAYMDEPNDEPNIPTIIQLQVLASSFHIFHLVREHVSSKSSD
ncbi:DUF6334 family protein [Tumidithrix elongata RA019]|uniref:DUF6334 family protein n=1 Tax=Tumidithrix elongata BACA0141 TaxID=2716417 RepID=A0AAW9PYL6_9CYAN|nr:DUF6334 family protein [Tumidithrix elongata RA019]